MNIQRIASITILLPILAAAPAPGRSIPVGFEVLENLELLPLLKEGVVCRQHSSYDRTGGNDDGFSGTYTHLRRTRDGEYVIFDADGPGCIYRFWSAQPPEGRIKFFFDGEKEPRLECGFRDMFEAKVAPFAPPLTGRSSGGWYSYHPIVFRKNCTIVTEQKTGFLAIAYHRFPDGTPVTSFRPTLDPEALALYESVQSHFADPAAREREVDLPLRRIVVPAGSAEFPLGDLAGPGTIAGVRARVLTESRATWRQDHTLRRLVLRIYWDGDPRPAVECPLGEFFGTGFGEYVPAPGGGAQPVRYAAVPFGMTDDFAYFRLPMPFRTSARVTLENGNEHAVDVDWALDAKKGPVADSAAYLHVQWRHHVTEQGRHVPILTTRGRGHYVGTVLSMQSPHWLTYLEGDEKFTVDGESFPGIHGTGTEDYFNCGWYYNSGPVAAPFHGLTAKPDYESRTSQYRMHVPDCVPFTRSLKVEIEHGEANDRPHTDYAIVSYWYQDATSHDVAWEVPPATSLRFPVHVVTDPGFGTFRPDEEWTRFAELAPALDVEATLQAGGGRVAIVPYRDLDPDWEGPPRLSVASDEPGAYIRWQVWAPHSDLYLLNLVAPRGPRFGVARLFVDGRPTEYTVDLHAERFHQAFIECETPFLMESGSRWLELRVVDRNPLSTGYDMAPGAALLRLGSAWPRQWNIAGPFPGDDDQGYRAVYPPEHGVELDAVYEGPQDRTIAWQTIEVRDLVWLHDRLKPSEEGVAYGHLFVDSPDDRRTVAYVGADDAGKLFVNGDLVWAVPGVHHLKADEYAVPVSLRAGRNEVLVKVAQAGGGWGFAFRLRNPEADLTYYSTTPETQP